ncbi:MAG: SLOG family protein [Clostridia bacterium]
MPSRKVKKIERELEIHIAALANQGITCFGSGGALGFDLMAADAVIAMRNKRPELKLIVFVPCRDQDKTWRESDRQHYRDVLAKADEVIYVGESYTDGCMHARNRRMVESASVCIAYLEKRTGGTAYTVNYAFGNGLKVYNLASGM